MTILPCQWLWICHSVSVQFPYPYMVYVQVCSYLLLIRHWTWHYITIVNSWVFLLQLLGTHWPTYTYLPTITIVIYLVLSLLLSIDHRPSGTYNYLLTYIYIVYLLQNNLLYSFISSTGYEPWLTHLKTWCTLFKFLKPQYDIIPLETWRWLSLHTQARISWENLGNLQR